MYEVVKAHGVGETGVLDYMGRARTAARRLLEQASGLHSRGAGLSREGRLGSYSS
jgi:hypothetical protein